jgi:hypothetical protein
MKRKLQLVSEYSFFLNSSRQNLAMMEENAVCNKKRQSASGDANGMDGRQKR